MAGGRIAIGVDVGGSGIKAAVVDVEAGPFRSERLRVPTPMPSTPDAVNASIVRLVKRLVRGRAVSATTTPVGDRPAGRHHRRRADDGRATSTRPGSTSRSSSGSRRRSTRPVSIVNDADAAGIAEMRFGVGRGSSRGSSSS